MFGYRVPAPDEAMLISGRGGGAEGSPFKVVIGRGSFVTPVFRKVRYLSLSLREAEVSEQCVTKQGISLNVRAVIAFKVGNDTESIVNAGQRFLWPRAATCPKMASSSFMSSRRKSSFTGRSRSRPASTRTPRSGSKSRFGIRWAPGHSRRSAGGADRRLDPLRDAALSPRAVRPAAGAQAGDCGLRRARGYGGDAACGPGGIVQASRSGRRLAGSRRFFAFGPSG